ncbi:MAG TPA: adenylate/guanylate cyclase domain-containing protein [Cyclobacteriaceae bacterium]|nr:adenylate/guanylate cyclase domain-containing protein [Cyclobacteriaceae bacterium]
MNAHTTLSIQQQGETGRAIRIIDSSLGLWQFRQAVTLTITATMVGLLYVVFVDGFDSLIPFINGGVIGFLGGAGVSLGELIVFKTFRKRISFIGIVLVKSSCYTLMMAALIFTVILISRTLQYGNTITETLNSESFRHFILHEDFTIIICYAITFISLLIFTREMSRKMGQGVLWNFITGQYFKPKQEKRIFMFLDLNSSTSQAEMLGDLQYHNLLNDFFRDLTDCILKAKGEIHHYVGDEVVVSWPMNRNTSTEICLQAYFCSLKKIESLSSRYQSRYGFVPKFKAAFHCGDVICGEIGEIKSEIVFHGDVMNTTARLERMCSELDKSMLISKAFYATLPPEQQGLFQKINRIPLRGKNQSLEVFEITTTAAR